MHEAGHLVPPQKNQNAILTRRGFRQLDVEVAAEVGAVVVAGILDAWIVV